MPKPIRAKPWPCNNLCVDHGLQDNVPGNSYVVKASGFPTARHAENLGIFPGFTPKTKQHQVSLTKRKFLRAGAAVIENVFVEQRIQLMERDVQVSSGLRLGKELFGWF